MCSYHVRGGSLRELERLRQIERRAGAGFADLGMAEIADDEPPGVEVLAEYCRADRLWVCADGADVAVGYVIVDRVDQCAHIEQVSVDPDHAGQRLGRLLIDTVADWARDEGLAAVTLTTFTEVPWNGPYYQRLGFAPLPANTLSPGLLQIRRREQAYGLDRWPRLCP